ncbi:hypothetical protein ACP6MG_07965 [Proteus mirabilis]|uniref:hypothetical protein n=1 Tax=Proteus mirabilis TaxID=584 RepID=UPI003F7D3850
MRIECYSWSDVSEQILQQAIALQNSAFEDMKGNFYQVDIPYKLVLAIDDNQVIGHVANLTTAINKYYQIFCIVPHPVPSNSVKSFPAEVKKELPGLFISEDEMEIKFKNDIKYFNAFESINLLDKEVIKNSQEEIIGYRYSPTAEGKKYLENDKSRYFCAGNYEVTSIVKINPPIEEAFKEVEVTKCLPLSLLYGLYAN